MTPFASDLTLWEQGKGPAKVSLRPMLSTTAGSNSNTHLRAIYTGSVAPTLNHTLTQEAESGSIRSTTGRAHVGRSNIRHKAGHMRGGMHMAGVIPKEDGGVINTLPLGIECRLLLRFSKAARNLKFKNLNLCSCTCKQAPKLPQWRASFFTPHLCPSCMKSNTYDITKICMQRQTGRQFIAFKRPTKFCTRSGRCLAIGCRSPFKGYLLCESGAQGFLLAVQWAEAR